MHGARRVWSALLVVALAFAWLAASAPAAAASAQSRVAIIVGPVGETLTPVYIALAEAAATAAESRGAVVSRAYSPAATPANVLTAVEGANIVVYLGHGFGSPNPHSGTFDPATMNGWGLQGPNARGDHSDSAVDGTIAYYGEAWIAANANPAPGWVMVYSNACYAAGAGEPHVAELVDLNVASQRVAGYSEAPLATLGASAYFAIDFYAGAAHLVSTLLDNPELPYGAVFATEPNFVGAGLTAMAHPALAQAEVWLHQSAYFDGRVDYWYAFAGDPDATFGGSTIPGGGAAHTFGGHTLQAGDASVAGTAVSVVAGRASWFPGQPGSESMAGIALPAELGGGVPQGEPHEVLVCAEQQCVELPVIDACPCFTGTSDERVGNLTAAAWAMLSDAPLEQGLLDIHVYLEPFPERLPGPPPGPFDAPRR